MSYDVSLRDAAGIIQSDWNFTSNMAPAWRAAGADLASFHGRLACACMVQLTRAIALMRENPRDWRKFDAPNGWGSIDTLVPALEVLADQFRAHPRATVVVCR